MSMIFVILVIIFLINFRYSNWLIINLKELIYIIVSVSEEKLSISINPYDKDVSTVLLILLVYIYQNYFKSNRISLIYTIIILEEQ